MPIVAKVIFTVLATITVVVPMIADLNATHLTNPRWLPHARFHAAVLYLGTTLLNLGILYLLWGSYPGQGSPLIAWIAAWGPLSFWGMFLPALLFPGVSTWPDGVTPPKNFPLLLTKIHPNVILALIVTLLSCTALYLAAGVPSS